MDSSSDSGSHSDHDNKSIKIQGSLPSSKHLQADKKDTQRSASKSGFVLDDEEEDAK